jgi:uncharacterized repeat protein (TIGR03803 family)
MKLKWALFGFAAAATTHNAFAQITDVGSFNVQKATTYDQTDAVTETRDPETPFQLYSQITPGSTGKLLAYSSLTPPSGSTGAIVYQASSNGLQGTEDFTSKANLDSAFPSGTYNLTIETSTPNTYQIPVPLGADNYPSVTPQLTNVTNSTWTNGVILITDPAQPTTFTWNAFNSSNGNIFFQINGNGQSFAADGTHNSITIPANTFTNNTVVAGSLNFTNSQDDSGIIPGLNGGTSFAIQVNFVVQTGTPAATPTLNVVDKAHVLIQTSNGAPANASGDNDAFDPAPYNLHVQSSAPGSINAPNTEVPLSFSAGDTDANTPYRFTSGPVTDQAALDSAYNDGTYTLIDGQNVSLTGDAYPNTPQITSVNGTTPVWDAQGRLVLSPGITNTITFTAFNVIATTFAANGHEEAGFQSIGDSIVNIKQTAGVSTGVTSSFNTLVIPANSMTGDRTYAGHIEYYLASSITNPSGSVYDTAGYDTETNFIAIASNAVGLTQVINFPALNPNQVAGTQLTLLATATSGLPVTFNIVSGPATLSGNVVTFTSTGTVVVQASQAGNSTYANAASVTQTFTVGSSSSAGTSQTITFPPISSPQNSGIPITLAATSTSGLPILYSISTGPGVVTGNVLSFTGAGSVTVNADQPGNGTFAAAPTASQSFSVNVPTELTFYQIQKNANFVQSSASPPVADPSRPYEFISYASTGSTGSLLSTSTLTTPAGGIGSVTYSASGNGLNFDEGFINKATLDSAFPAGSYNLSVQTDVPNTYVGKAVVAADNYPSVTPQITAMTNATWSGGNIVVSNLAVDTIITFNTFNSATGSIYYNINGLTSQTFAADGTHTSFTIPANSLTNNTLYHVNLGFQNFAGMNAIGGVPGNYAYTNQLNFNIQVGTLATSPNLYIVKKAHILVQKSSGVPVDASGDIVDKAPYNFDIESPVSGNVNGPASKVYPLVYDFQGEEAGNGGYRFSSGTKASQSSLDSTFLDGSYVMTDGNTVTLTGDNYPSTPQITQINGFPPIWNSAGQLVLDPTVDNTITWSAFSGGTFATNGHEEAEFDSDNDDSINFQQTAGVTASSSTAFTTLDIPPGTLTTNHTYTASIDYILASSINSPSANNYDVAGYETKTYFSVLAQPLPSAFSPTFNSATDVGVTSSSYIATGINLTINLNFAPTASTTLTVINNTGSGPITGTFNNVAEGGTFSTVFGGTTYTFTATYKGGDGNDMTLTYTPPLPPASVTILHNFSDGTVVNDGAGPSCTLIPGTDGNFYGTAMFNGANNDGTVFRMSPSGQTTILYSFGNPAVTNDGQGPSTSLVLGPDGNFYGLTNGGGSNGTGVAFRMTPQGAVTILHNFGDGSVANDGQNPSNAFILASDGNFYSTTFGGGSTGAGVVFEMSLTGQVTILHSFGDGTVANDGAASAGPLVQAGDGNFYGTTQYGGTAGVGTVFKITRQGQVTILHSFNDGTVINDGTGPQAGLIQGPDGNLYGMTETGGVRNSYQGAGIVFKTSTQGAYTVLHRFSDGSVRNDGQIPSGELVLGKDGNYYGMTQNGGGTTQLQDLGTGSGSIFEMTPQGVVTILHSFNDGSVLNDGAVPMHNLVQASDGTFYGVTYQGGSTTSGVAFKFTPGLPSITSAPTANATVGLQFSYQVTATNLPTNYSATNLPDGLSIDAGTGLIAGTPTTPGTNVVVITTSNSKGPTSSPLTITVSALPVPVVTSILSAYAKSETPFSYAVIATNNPTSYSASGLPNGLSINPSTGLISGTPTDTGDFSVNLTATNSAGDSAPTPTPLIIHLFSTPPVAADEYNVLYRFDPGSSYTDGTGPRALFQGFDGTLYGVTTGGGLSRGGTVFNTTSQGITTTLTALGTGLGDAFASAPQDLQQAADGSLYGTTLSGGAANLGTVFKIATDGTLTILHSFGDGSVTNDGASPQYLGLTQGTDGNFYGVTTTGGSQGKGVIYRITPLGVVSILHSFGDGTVAADGSTPRGNLIQGTDGNFYGTTKLGGSVGSGTIFKVTPLGVVTILHSFGDGSITNDGANPHGALFLAANGNFYGTTKNGGSSGAGTVFQMTSGYVVTTLHNFGDGSVAADGANPLAGVIQGFDGNLYGVTNLGGAANGGTVFEITTAGVVTIIHQFGDGSLANDGLLPTSALTQDANGNFYGTTSSGGTNSNGTIFTFVTTQPTTHVPIFTGASTLTSAELTPLSFTPKALFSVSASDGQNTSNFQPSIVPLIIRPNFSVATSWVLTGTLPQFLTFDSTSGTISGTPIQPGTYTITMASTNATGTGASATVTIYVDVPPTITSSSAASGSVGSTFSYSIAANANPTSFGATGLPGWLSVNTITGVISGTPPGAGTYVFSPTASNVAGTGTKTVTLTVGSGASNAPAITSAATTNVVVGTSFSYQITATNSPTSFTALSLPSGLTFDSTTGMISGTPTSVGTYSVPITATNASGTSSSVLNLTVDPAVAPVITSSSLITCTPSSPVTYQIVGTNSPRAFTASGLPSGLSLNTATGAITGTPTSVGDSTVTLTASNSVGTGTATLALSVQANTNLPAVTSSTNVTSTATLPYTYQLVATNNPTSYDATGLPPGLTIDTTTGIISGTPTENGIYTVTVYATSPSLGTGTANITLSVSSPTYAQWASVHTGTSNPDAVTEGDGVPNLLKYVFDIDPTTPMTEAEREGLPSVGMVTSGSTTYLTLDFREYRFLNGITLVLQSSTDMKTWTTVTSPDYMQANVDQASGDTIMEVGVKMTGGKQYLRLNATAP